VHRGGRVSLVFSLGRSEFMGETRTNLVIEDLKI